MAQFNQRTEDIPPKMRFRASRLSLYIVATGWLAFLVTLSQAFQWMDFDDAFMNLFSFEIKQLPMRAITLAIPLILTIIGYLVYEREKYLGHIISTGRRLESKNISLETSYKKLYGKMKDGVAGSAHTLLLEESRLMARGASAVFSDIIDYRIKHLSDEASNALKEDRLRFRTIFLLQEALMKASEPGALDVRAYLNAICRELIEGVQASHVKLDIDVKDARMGVNTLFPCGVIVCELVMNSLKHAFEGINEPGIKVSLVSPANGQAVLWVMDNGIGIPVGLDISASDTMGFRMVNRMARAMNANITRDQSDSGTVLALAFGLSGRLPG